VGRLRCWAVGWRIAHSSCRVRALPSQRRRTRVLPARIGSVSQETKNA
jgi:hypothetical protein